LRKNTKEIAGFPGYLIDRDGVIIGRRGWPLKTSDHRGYAMVTLYNGPMIKHRHHRYVHVLVAENYLGPRPLGHEVNHIDHDKGNNSAENLEWLTHLENISKAKELGLYDKKLTEAQRQAIRDDPRSYKEIVADYQDINCNTVATLKRRMRKSNTLI